MALKPLDQLQHGCPTLTEQGRLAGQFGDKSSELRAILMLKSLTFIAACWSVAVSVQQNCIDKIWETNDLTAVIQIFARNLPALDKLESRVAWLTFPINKYNHWANRNHKQQAKRNISAHYDLGNELYSRFLDPHMQYSSALFHSATESLEQAQVNKMDRLCQQLDLKPTDHLLEIGTGWGGLAVYAAKHYGCHVTTTTISEEQYRYAEQRIKTKVWKTGLRC